jgi:tryptophan synthase alpha chain
MSRLDAAFRSMRGEQRVGLITYITAGDPDLTRSEELLFALDRSGADVLEVGVPFSDPVADGPVIERASARARAAGGTLASSLQLVERVRDRVRAPIVLFTYANPVFRMDERAFAARAAAAGVDGALLVDLPIEEAGGIRETLAAAGIDLIFLLSPTTSDERIARAAALGRGFLYAISRLGVTGARDTLPEGARELVGRIRARTSLPVAVGFGISTPEHVRSVGAWADAAVVGSALVNVIAESAGTPDLPARVEAYVRWLRGGEPGGASKGQP